MLKGLNYVERWKMLWLLQQVCANLFCPYYHFAFCQVVMYWVMAYCLTNGTGFVDGLEMGNNTKVKPIEVLSYNLLQ